MSRTVSVVEVLESSGPITSRQRRATVVVFSV
jgi:hypothetical protein